MAQRSEGYVLHAYGGEQYLHHAVTSAVTLRQHDARRLIALFCPPEATLRLSPNRLNSLYGAARRFLTDS